MAGAQYVEVEDVDLLQTVDDFITCWVSEEKLDVYRGLVTLRLVACGARKPTAEEEAAATVLSPRRTLRDAGVTSTAWLLAVVAGACSALCIRLAGRLIVFAYTCSSLADASVAARDLALRDLDAALQQAREYQAALG